MGLGGVRDEAAGDELGDVGGETVGEGFRQAEGLTAEELDLVGEAAAGAEDVVGQLGEDGGEACGVGVELGEGGLGLEGEVGEGDGGLGTGCWGSQRLEGWEDGVEVGGWVEGGGTQKVVEEGVGDVGRLWLH